MNKLITRLADKFILCPSRDPIAVEDKRQHLIHYDGTQRLEIWIHESQQNPDAYLLKFPGTGGRAENSTIHPAEFWQDIATEVWTVNPPGYGNSSGRASLRNVSPMIDLLILEFQRLGNPSVFVHTNSLGSLAGFLFAIRYTNVVGMVVRNPVPLKEIVVSRRSLIKPKWAVNMVARQVPGELDCIENAKRINVSALFVTSEFDRVIPPAYQQLIFQNYAGPKDTFVIQDGDHQDLPQEDAIPEFHAKMNWLLAQSAISPRG
jgi:pimeloyl-ACP methyl ester carboxylesterase